ncbi:hypothetical protein F0562_020495 [Nyssa sinensis]|uniref:Pentatricopeptide repeat-containing protein n=1 Tax=Nyssa sinensis TaxID=561372 RepID=A0A5J5BTX0_9ASTE|nr:hypothetical protein F0562_020495 [Nyssa sinensis]
MHTNGVPIDTYTLCSSLTASSCIKTVKFGKQLHTYVEKSGWSSSVFVGSALVDLYAKSLLINDASVMFDEIPVKNTVCANALLSGYAEARMWVEGLELVRKMPGLNLNYDNLTLTAMFRACAGLSAVEFGRQVHANVIRTVPDFGADVFLQSSLIEMYGKCGLVKKAREVFNMAGFGREIVRKSDVVLWTSMLGVYGRNGHFKEVIELYKEMLMDGIRPDEVAFLTVISACGHTGQVNLGIEYFESMAHDLGLSPGPEHHSCLVDLLCRAGELEKAWKLVNEMPSVKNGSCSVSLWGALLNACIDCGNIELGKLAARRALELDPQNVGIYVLLSNMYARYGLWDEIGHLRELMKERGLKKDIGCSWIETSKSKGFHGLQTQASHPQECTSYNQPSPETLELYCNLEGIPESSSPATKSKVQLILTLVGPLQNQSTPKWLNLQMTLTRRA